MASALTVVWQDFHFYDRLYHLGIYSKIPSSCLTHRWCLIPQCNCLSHLSYALSREIKLFSVSIVELARLPFPFPHTLTDRKPVLIAQYQPLLLLFPYSINNFSFPLEGGHSQLLLAHSDDHHETLAP